MGFKEKPITKKKKAVNVLWFHNEAVSVKHVGLCQSVTCTVV